MSKKHNRNKYWIANHYSIENDKQMHSGEKLDDLKNKNQYK